MKGVDDGLHHTKAVQVENAKCVCVCASVCLWIGEKGGERLGEGGIVVFNALLSSAIYKTGEKKFSS